MKIKKEPPVQVFNGEEYHLYPGERYFSRGNKKLHWVVWEYYNGEIPKGYEVHHKDHNAFNNDISNLELLTEEQHKRHHTMEIKQSETRIIKRSQINLNPLNPKRHTEEAIKLQKKNLRKVGFLGGVVWNEQTGNLIDGHRRVFAMDEIMKYDETPETDYDVKVEVVSMDEKTEKEQMTYMAVGDTQADMDLIADYIKDIDYSDLGLSDMKLSEIMAIAGVDPVADEPINDLMEDIVAAAEPEPEKVEEVSETYALQNPEAAAVVVAKPAMTREEKIAHVKNVKNEQKEQAENYSDHNDAYVVLSFENYENYLNFCEVANIPEGAKYIKGETILEKIS